MSEQKHDVWRSGPWLLPDDEKKNKERKKRKEKKRKRRRRKWSALPHLPVSLSFITGRASGWLCYWCLLFGERFIKWNLTQTRSSCKLQQHLWIWAPPPPHPPPPPFPKGLINPDLWFIIPGLSFSVVILRGDESQAENRDVLGNYSEWKRLTSGPDVWWRRQVVVVQDGFWVRWQVVEVGGGWDRGQASGFLNPWRDYGEERSEVVLDRCDHLEAGNIMSHTVVLLQAEEISAGFHAPSLYVMNAVFLSEGLKLSVSPCWFWCWSPAQTLSFFCVCVTKAQILPVNTLQTHVWEFYLRSEFIHLETTETVHLIWLNQTLFILTDRQVSWVRSSTKSFTQCCCCYCYYFVFVLSTLSKPSDSACCYFHSHHSRNYLVLPR